MALDDVCLDLENENYATQSFIIPACSVGAPHKRDRLWVIAKLWATPQAMDGMRLTQIRKKQNCQQRQNKGMFQSPRTGTLKEISNSIAGFLNPQFVEFLMGFPHNWTKID